MVLAGHSQWFVRTFGEPGAESLRIPVRTSGTQRSNAAHNGHEMGMVKIREACGTSNAGCTTSVTLSHRSSRERVTPENNDAGTDGAHEPGHARTILPHPNGGEENGSRCG